MHILLERIAQYWKHLTILSLSVITYFSLTPLPELPLPGNDKTHHFVAYGLLMFPVALKSPKNWKMLALFFIAWSGAIELIQPYVNRHGEWLDLLANSTGILLGATLAWILKIIFNKNIEINH